MKEKMDTITENATRLYSQNGIYSVSMDDIAISSGISKRTLYTNFQSKEFLVEEITKKLTARTGTYIRLCTDMSPNAVKEIENFTSHVRDVLVTITPKFIWDLKKYYPSSYTRLRIFTDNTIIPYIQQCVKRGIKEDIFRSELNRSHIGWFYCWQIQNVLEGSIAYQNTKMIIEQINEMFLHSMLSWKGLKLVTTYNQSVSNRQNPIQRSQEMKDRITNDQS